MTNMNGGTKFLHADFGLNPDYGIPFVVVPGTQPKVPMVFDYADDSDPGPYPIPPNAPIEGGASSSGDRHILVLDKDNTSSMRLLVPITLARDGNAGLAQSSTSPQIVCVPTIGLRQMPLAFRSFPDLSATTKLWLPAKSGMQSGLLWLAPKKAFIHPATHYASSFYRPQFATHGTPCSIESQLQPDSLHWRCPRHLGGPQEIRHVTWLTTDQTGTSREPLIPAGTTMI